MFGHKVLLLLALLAVAAGCGSELGLVVRASDAEKDGPAAKLARTVELRYLTPSGKNRFHRAVSVSGLSRPVPVHAEFDDRFRLERGGRFVAKAFADDGELLLQGASGEPDSNGRIEIILGREETAEYGSALLQAIAMDGSRGEPMPRVTAAEIRKAKDRGGCFFLPTITVRQPRPSRGPTRILLESREQRTGLSFLSGELDGRGVFKPWDQNPQPASLNKEGQLELALGESFRGGNLLRQPENFVIQLYSIHYEGCLAIKTVPEVLPVALTIEDERGAGRLIGHWAGPGRMIFNEIGFLAFPPRARVRLSNPNPFPVIAALDLKATEGTLTVGEVPDIFASKDVVRTDIGHRRQELKAGAVWDSYIFYSYLDPLWGMPILVAGFSVEAQFSAAPSWDPTPGSAGTGKLQHLVR